MNVVHALAGHAAGRLALVDVHKTNERARGFAPGLRHLPASRCTPEGTMAEPVAAGLAPEALDASLPFHLAVKGSA